ncbi:MAG TPA: hypothetical protein HA306_08485 [Methanosarcina sp.]|nr:hypothetical protein [Methanosarcina sp.]
MSLEKIFTVVYFFMELGILVGFVTPIGEYLIGCRMQKAEKKIYDNEKSEDNPDFSGVIRKVDGKNIRLKNIRFILQNYYVRLIKYVVI